MTLHSLALYKQKPAIVREFFDDGKISIETANGKIRVREKDIEPLHPGPVNNLNDFETATAAGGAADGLPDNFEDEAWELFSGEETPPSFKELCELAGGWTAQIAWKVHKIIERGLCFENAPHWQPEAAVMPRPREAVEAAKAKLGVKESEAAERADFLPRLKAKMLKMPDDMRFMQDVEALALGKSEKSRALKDAGIEETPQAAHKILLETGIWDESVNPHPARLKINMSQPKQAGLNSDDAKLERVDLTHLDAYAIDDEGSKDPDDALSLEADGDGFILYVHVADPSAQILPDSEADREARARGATFYSPEGVVLMLCEDALNHYALGLNETSSALTIKIWLDSSCAIKKTGIFKSRIKVTRLTYASACADDGMASHAGIKALFALAEKKRRRREDAGAIFIEFPEVQIFVKDGEVKIERQENLPSRALVRECMLIAGEAAAEWALEIRAGNQNFAFPFISQQVESVPKETLPGLAGSYQLRRCMRQRVLSTKPGLHEGLGLDIYTQVTSPLRRYTDLLAHQQISAILQNEIPLDEEELLMRLSAAERAAIDISRAERASRAHWTAVFCSRLLAKKNGAEFEAVILEPRGPHAIVFIPALGLEANIALPRGKSAEPNDALILTVSSVNIPESEIRWNVV